MRKFGRGVVVSTAARVRQAVSATRTLSPSATCLFNMTERSEQEFYPIVRHRVGLCAVPGAGRPWCKSTRPARLGGNQRQRHGDTEKPNDFSVSRCLRGYSATSEQVLQGELHLSGNRISRARDASERRRTEVSVWRLEVRIIGDVVHLDTDLDDLRSGLAHRLAEREVDAALRRAVHGA